MTVRNRIGAITALAVAGVLMVAAPVSAATTHTSYHARVVVTAPDQKAGGAGKSPSPDDGGAKWFGIGGGLLAGIGLGAGFVFWRKQKDGTA